MNVNSEYQINPKIKCYTHDPQKHSFWSSSKLNRALSELYGDTKRDELINERIRTHGMAREIFNQFSENFQSHGLSYGQVSWEAIEIDPCLRKGFVYNIQTFDESLNIVLREDGFHLYKKTEDVEEAQSTKLTNEQEMLIAISEESSDFTTPHFEIFYEDLTLGMYTDMVFEVRGGSLRAHQLIVCSKSDVIKQSIEEKKSLEQPCTMDLSEFSKEAVKLLMDTLYQKKICIHDLDILILVELFLISHQFNFVDLLTICRRELERRVESQIQEGWNDIEEIVEHVIFAKTYQNTHTLHICLRHLESLVNPENAKEIDHLLRGCNFTPNKVGTLLSKCAFYLNSSEMSYSHELAFAKNGDTAAQYNLAMMYVDGKVVERNIDLAMKWLNTSADGGYISAISELGKIHRYGKYGLPKNYEQALYYLNIGVERNDSASLLTLGRIYRYGLPGIEPDHIKAIRYFERASESDVMGLYELSELHEKGECGFFVDEEEAIRLIQVASNIQGELQHYFKALYHIKKEPIDYDKVFKHLNNGMEQNCAYCINQLGILYAKGEGTEKDLKSARKYFKRAGELGLAKAHVNHSVSAADPKKSLALEKAAFLGDETAYLYLGSKYLEKAEDIAKGLELIEKAKGGQNFEGMEWLQKGFGYDWSKNYEDLIHHFRLACEEGVNKSLRYLQEDKSPIAKFCIAYMYHHGKGVDKDLKRATQIYESLAYQEDYFQFDDLYISVLNERGYYDSVTRFIAERNRRTRERSRKSRE